MIEHPYEAIIVGSGATGGVAALTLAENGVRVLLIEAGPQLSLKQALGSEPINSFRRVFGIISKEKSIQSQHPGYWKANPLLYANEKENPYSHPSQKPFFWTQGRQLGGRSLTWGGITLRLSNNELKASHLDGYGPEWPFDYSELAPHYEALEKRLETYGNKDGLEQLPDGEYSEALPFTESEKIFSNSIRNSLRHPVIHSRGFGPHIPKSNTHWPPSSSPGSTLKMAIKTGKVELLPNHLAEQLVIDTVNEKAKSVVVIDQKDGSRKELKGSLIVLCASTIQTLRILLNSESKQQKNGFIDPSNNLGRNLMDHISICRFFSFPKGEMNPNNKQILANQKLSGAGSFFIPFGRNLQTTKEPNFIRGYGIWGAIDRFDPPKCLKQIPESSTGFLIGHGEVLPSVDNKVTLANRTDKWGIPIPHIDCQWGANELEMTKHMKTTIHEIIETAGGSVLPIEKLFKIPFAKTLTRDAVALGDQAPPPGYYIHEVGGAPMGVSEKTSVVDKFNRLWRCRNVLVVDGSCWPTSGWQSPTLTMMAITRRACLEAIKPRSY